jgi:hypothetical protein
MIGIITYQHICIDCMQLRGEIDTFDICRTGSFL